MKKINILYWVFTGLFAAAMIFTSVGNVLMDPQSIDLIHTQLGYPEYFVAFVGWAKIIGVIAVLVPGFPRLKEWAYAGLFFDLTGATYSAIALWGFKPPMLTMLVFFGLLFLSYHYYHKRRKAKEGAAIQY